MIQLKQMRDRTTAALIAAAIPGVGPSVFPSRARSGWPEEGDFLCVYTQASDMDDQDTAPVIYSVKTDLVIRVVVQKAQRDQDLEDRMDQITEAVVLTMLPVHGITGPLDGLLDDLRLRAVRPTLSPDGEVLKFSQQVLFSAEWRRAIPDDTPPDDFLRAGTVLGAPAAAQAPDLDATFTTNMRTP